MHEKDFDLKCFYEKKIWGYHDITNIYEEIRVKTLVECLAPTSTDIILDVGCGGGTYSSILSRNANVISLDLSKQAIKNAKKHLKKKQGISFIISDIRKLPLADTTIDKILCIDVIEHIENSKEVFAELSRVVKPFGRTLIFTACGKNKLTLENILDPIFNRIFKKIQLKMGHIKIFSTSNLIGLLESDFTISAVQYMHHWIGWFLKFIWDITHLNSSEIYFRSYSQQGLSQIFVRALGFLLKKEYELLRNRSLGTEIIIIAVKKA